MPICEADPWRLQYFEGVPCPAHVRVPTEDPDAFAWNPRENWVYDKMRVAQSQGLAAGAFGAMPESIRCSRSLESICAAWGATSTF